MKGVKDCDTKIPEIIQQMIPVFSMAFLMKAFDDSKSETRNLKSEYSFHQNHGAGKRKMVLMAH